MFRLLLAMWVLFSASSVHAAGVGGAFGEGRSQFSLVAGNAYAFDNNYFVLGGSASYYVKDGLAVGLSLENWSGGGPGITKYAPFVQYVFNRESPMQLYVGGFYRHTSISGLPGVNSVGERAGAMMAAGTNAFLSVGIVHETYLDCQVPVYRVCSETHPDMNVTIGF